MSTSHSPDEITFSWHATSRMHTLQITPEEVAAVARAPLATWPGKPGRHGTSSHCVGKNILVLLAADNRTVITVKLRSLTPYVHGVHTRRDGPDPIAA